VTNSSFTIPDVFPLQSKRTGKSVLMTHRGRWLPPAMVISIFSHRGSP